MKQVILGAGGDIGTLLAKELKSFTDQIRLASRTPVQVHTDDELLPADLRDYEQVDGAIAGTAVAYLVIGLKYDLKVWQRDWPLIIHHVIKACLKHNTKLVFFDNVYLYDRKAIPHMTENSLVKPPSQKGQIRQAVVDAIWQAVHQHGLKALIARSADFYGPDSKNGILNVLLLNPLNKGKKPNWQARVDKIHSFTYTPDAAKATALLGNTEWAYNHSWHLPTSPERWTGLDFIQAASNAYQTKPTYFLLKPWMLKIGGLFDTTIRELIEMQYQNDQDYFFDSSHFCQAFNFTPTSYAEGIKAGMFDRNAANKA